MLYINICTDIQFIGYNKPVTTRRNEINNQCHVTISNNELHQQLIKYGRRG